jgi:hypothetical protein
MHIKDLPNQKGMFPMNYEDLMKLASTTVNRCFLCDAGDIEVMGCFVPGKDEAERYWPTKLKPNKTRTFWYGLCSRCDRMPKKQAAARVEERMEREARAARQ